MRTYHLSRYGYIAARWDVSVEAESAAEAIAKVDSEHEDVDWDCGFDWFDDIQHFDDPGDCPRCQRLQMDTEVTSVDD